MMLLGEVLLRCRPIVRRTGWSQDLYEDFKIEDFFKLSVCNICSKVFDLLLGRNETCTSKLVIMSVPYG
jgi:hypothetical protein